MPVVVPMAGNAETLPRSIEAIYRTSLRQVFATLIRLPGDFDPADESRCRVDILSCA